MSFNFNSPQDNNYPQQFDEYQQHQQPNTGEYNSNTEQQHQQQEYEDDQSKQEEQQGEDNGNIYMTQQDLNDQFYLRYYAGHSSNLTGHEFIEFELRGDGTLRYANDSQYKKGTEIRKQLKLSAPFLQWIRERVVECDIINADDSTWPSENQVGRQEFELKLDGAHIFFATCKFSSRAEVLQLNADPSLETFYHLTNDLRLWFFDTIGLHFRMNEV